MLFDCIIPSRTSQYSYSATTVNDVGGRCRKFAKGGVCMCMSVCVRWREGVLFLFVCMYEQICVYTCGVWMCVCDV